MIKEEEAGPTSVIDLSPPPFLSGFRAARERFSVPQLLPLTEFCQSISFLLVSYGLDTIFTFTNRRLLTRGRNVNTSLNKYPFEYLKSKCYQIVSSALQQDQIGCLVVLIRYMEIAPLKPHDAATWTR